MILCSELQRRLDAAWTRLQRELLERSGGEVSQIDLDTACVTWFEAAVASVEAEQ